MNGRVSTEAAERLAAETDMARRDYQPLGRRMFSRGFVLRGELSDGQWRQFLIRCARDMGMSTVAHATIWHYPIDGSGGNGFTIVQPITESFLALDVWPDHGGAYLFVCSCKEFFPVHLRQAIAFFGLAEGEMSDPIMLKLDPEA